MKSAAKFLNPNVGFFVFALCSAIFFLYACCGGSDGGSGGGSGGGDGPDYENGSISYALKWVDDSAASIPKNLVLHSDDACVDYGIELITADIFDAANTAVTSDSWPCPDYQDTIDEVPAGSRYSLIVEGTVGSGDVDWRGEAADIIVAAGETTDVGFVIMIYVGDDETSPQVVSTDPLDEAVCAPVDAVITAVFSEAMIAASINESTFILKIGPNKVNGKVTYEPSAKAATFTPDNYLSPSELFTATITTGAQDMAGNPITEEVSWSFTTTDASDYDMDCDVDGIDLAIFASAYEAGSPEADLNDDGEINSADVEMFSRVFGTLPM